MSNKIASNKTAFIFPKGLQFQQESDGLCIEFEHDIIIQAPIGIPIKRIHSKQGNIHLDITGAVDELKAPKGKITLSRPIQAQKVEGHVIESLSSLQCNTLLSHGNLNVAHDLHCEQLISKGTTIIGGNARLQVLTIHGAAKFASNLNCTQAEFHGDVIIQGSCSGENIETKGNLHCRGNCKAERIISDQAKVVFEKECELKLLRALSINLKGNLNHITAIQAHRSVTISEGMLNSDVLVSPKVDIHPNTIGKIMIVDVQSPLGPHSVKGCLSPEDIAPLLPNPQHFITQRGILLEPPKPQPAQRPIEKKVEPVTVEVESEPAVPKPAIKDGYDIYMDSLRQPLEPKEPATHSTATPEKQEPEDQSVELEKNDFHTELQGILPTASPKDVVTIQEESSEDSIEEPSINEEKVQTLFSSEETPSITPISLVSEDPESQSTDDDDFSEEIPPYAASDKAVVVLHSTSSTVAKNTNQDNMDMLPMDDIPVLSSSNNGLYEQLRAHMQDINSSYAQNKNGNPAALETLNELIENENYQGLREDIKIIWQRILRFHQKRNSRIPNKVTIAFNEINKLLN